MVKTKALMPVEMLDALEESDEAFLRRLEYEDPIRKASIWLHKLIIHRIRDIRTVAPWYRGEQDEPCGKLVSELLNQKDGRFCDRFSYYCTTIMKYRQGCLPKLVIEEDCRIACLFVAELTKLADDTETLRLLERRIREFMNLLTSRTNGVFTRDSFINKVGQLSDSIVTICGRVSDQFKRIEKIRRGERIEPATAKDVAEIVEGEAGKMRRTIRRTARKVVKEIRTNAQSEYDRRGPSSSVRASQFRAVVKRLVEFKADERKLPPTLRGKHPFKWIHQACRDVWTEMVDGYPTPDYLYGYCQRNKETVISLAGL